MAAPCDHRSEQRTVPVRWDWTGNDVQRSAFNPVRQVSLAELVQPDTARAASLLLAQDGRFLLGARPPTEERGRIVLRLTGIGGWAEEGETFDATIHREVVEETGSDVRLLHVDPTMIVRSPDDIEPVDIIGAPTPVALVFRRFGTGPFNPWAEDFQRVAPVAVYAGVLLHPARIAKHDEHPFFMWLHPEHLIALSDADEPLEYLLADGAEMFGTFTGDRSRSLVRLTDSIQALVTALGARAFALLSDIARLTQPAAAE
jgi:8-oxo-dGTP pyrophosphatase MutT (NUDIX family)